VLRLRRLPEASNAVASVTGLPTIRMVGNYGLNGSKEIDMAFIESYPTQKQARKAAVEWKLRWKHGSTVIKKEQSSALFKRTRWVYNLYSK